MAKDCFAGSETVRLEAGQDRLISHINAGDRVLAADAAGKMSFSEVVFVPHKANKDTAAFVHITTASGRDIKMTNSHVLPAGACGNYSPLPLKYASQVTVNDCIMTSTGEEKVSSVGMALAEGAYTLVVYDEFIIVNGIVASPFAYNHIAGNLYYHIHRFLYSVTPWLLSSPLLRSSNEVRLITPSNVKSFLREHYPDKNVHHLFTIIAGARIPSSHHRLHREIKHYIQNSPFPRSLCPIQMSL